VTTSLPFSLYCWPFDQERAKSRHIMTNSSHLQCRELQCRCRRNNTSGEAESSLSLALTSHLTQAKDRSPKLHDVVLSQSHVDELKKKRRDQPLPVNILRLTPCISRSFSMLAPSTVGKAELPQSRVPHFLIYPDSMKRYRAFENGVFPGLPDLLAS
jgi:hypothetical protein